MYFAGLSVNGLESDFKRLDSKFGARPPVKGKARVLQAMQQERLDSFLAGRTAPAPKSAPIDPKLKGKHRVAAAIRAEMHLPETE
jgi:hypothetical protein